MLRTLTPDPNTGLTRASVWFCAFVTYAESSVLGVRQVVRLLPLERFGCTACLSDPPES